MSINKTWPMSNLSSEEDWEDMLSFTFPRTVFVRIAVQVLDELFEVQAFPCYCRQSQQFAFCFSRTELCGATHNPAQRLDLFALLGNQQLRVAGNVDDQDMPDLQ